MNTVKALYNGPLYKTRSMNGYLYGHYKNIVDFHCTLRVDKKNCHHSPSKPSKFNFL